MIFGGSVLSSGDAYLLGVSTGIALSLLVGIITILAASRRHGK